MAINIRKLATDSGYIIDECPYDTTNIVCKRGHIYADGKSFVACMDAAIPTESRALRKLGTVIADGDFGELSVAFSPRVFRDVARILKPRQAAIQNRAA